jgi:hypothetical protein
VGIIPFVKRPHQSTRVAEFAPLQQPLKTCGFTTLSLFAKETLPRRHDRHFDLHYKHASSGRVKHFVSAA